MSKKISELVAVSSVVATDLFEVSSDSSSKKATALQLKDYISGEFMGAAGTVTDNALLRADGTTGDASQGSVVLVDDSGNMTGVASLGATGARLTKGWFTDIESTNVPTVGGVALPVASQIFDFNGFIESPDDKTYVISINTSFAGSITETTTQSASGTCTATFNIDGTPLGGTANSVSSSEQSQAHASTNAFSAGQNINLVVTSNSSCADMAFKIKYTRTLA